ncbi:MAG: ABC transporter permease [Deltaproteobacteria bacterium]|nr:ABC transporter permease [Deltaproteobacteria bacterium]
MLTVIRRIKTLMVKELLILLRDPRGRSILIVPPVLQLLLFAYSVTLEVTNVSIIILNQDMGIHGSELTSRVAASRYFSSIIMAESPQKVQEALDRQDVLLALHFPQDFSAKVESRRGSSLQVLSDGRRSNAAQIVTAYLTEIARDYSAELTGTSGDETLEISTRHWFNPDLIYVWTVIPSLMVIITLVMTLNVAAMSLAREKELGTFEQLLVSPFTPAEIIIGKLIPAMFLAVFESMLIFALGRFLYGAPMRGSFPLLLASVIVFSFSIIGFGFFVSSIVKNQQQAIVGVFMFLVPSVALSGFAAPVENMPSWLQKAVILNPIKHSMIIMNGIFLKDMPAKEVWLNAWPLVAIGVVSMTFAGWMFRRNLG